MGEGQKGISKEYMEGHDRIFGNSSNITPRLSELEELRALHSAALAEIECLEDDVDELADRVMELSAICIANGWNPEGMSEVE